MPVKFKTKGIYHVDIHEHFTYGENPTNVLEESYPTMGEAMVSVLKWASEYSPVMNVPVTFNDVNVDYAAGDIFCEAGVSDNPTHYFSIISVD